MNDLTMSKASVRGTARDPKHIFNQCIEQLIELCGDVWTDYNKHDPGVTFVEVLSYLLTELSFRSQGPITDVLVDGVNNADARQAILDQQFPSPDNVLPCAPLTEQDYRKLIIDQPNVNNAWLVPYSVTLYVDSRDDSVTVSAREGRTISRFELRGGFKVKLLLSDGLNQAEKNDTINGVEALLHANRNLCQWFDSPQIISKQGFIVCAEIEIAAKAEATRVAANVWHKIQTYLQKPIPHLGPQNTVEYLDWPAELFNGPLLNNGYIDNQSLANSELRKQIRLSDIINLIMDIDGVLAVKELIINPEGQSKPLDNIWLIHVKPEKQATLKPQLGNLAFFKRELPTFFDKKAALSEYRKLNNASQDSTHQAANYDLSVKLGKNRNIKQYHSLQWDLPALYGLGESGLPADASEKRKAQVLQLRGYLAFFDQLAANFLAQTSGIRFLLSLDKDQSASYFSQVPTSIKDYQKLYGNEPQASITLASLVSDASKDADRRNRFLDFMLARFGEDMTGLTDVMLNAIDPSLRNPLEYKIDFYEAIPQVSRDRAMAHNYALKDQVWNTNNVSGLAKRICRLLGIANHSRRNLSDIAYDIYAEIDKTPDDEFRFRIRNKEDDKILLSSSTNYVTRQDAIKEMREAITAGMELSAYDILKTKNGRYYFNVVDESGEVIARRIEYFKTLNDTRKAIRQVVEYLNVNYSDEGMYLLEHFLLAPNADNEPNLAICVDEECAQCSDPYSYQIHIILPGYGKRFGNIDFRRYCEGVIRTEVPAHIMPRICWIDKDNMALFERAYKDWLATIHGASSTQVRQKKQALIDALSHIHNLYPVEKLHDCESDITGFVVGRTALGTLKEST